MQALASCSQLCHQISHVARLGTACNSPLLQSLHETLQLLQPRATACRAESPWRVCAALRAVGCELLRDNQEHDAAEAAHAICDALATEARAAVRAACAASQRAGLSLCAALAGTLDKVAAAARVLPALDPAYAIWKSCARLGTEVGSSCSAA